MRSFNSITITANLGKAPEVRYSQKGEAICTFSVALSDRKKNKDGAYADVTTWVRVTCFGKTAENAGQYLDKGSQVLVHGRLDVDVWKDKEGKERTTVGITANDVHYIGGKPDGAKKAKPADKPKDARPEQVSAAVDGEIDEIPFAQHERGFSW